MSHDTIFDTLGGYRRPLLPRFPAWGGRCSLPRKGRAICIREIEGRSLVIELALALLAVPVFWAFAEWRFGLLACLVTAILQDPLRKLAPDQPIFFVVFVGVVFAAACLGALVRGVPLNPTDIFERNRRIVMLMWLLLLLIIVQAINSFAHFGNPMITLVGLADVFAAIAFNRICIPACRSRRRSSYSSIYQELRRFDHDCADNNLPRVRGL